MLIYRKLEDPLIDRFSNLLKPTFKVAWLRGMASRTRSRSMRPTLRPTGLLTVWQTGPTRLDEREAAAVRLHDAEAAIIAGGLEGGRKTVQIARHHGLHVGRQSRGRAALVFAELAADLGRTGDSEAGVDLAHQGRQALLVLGVDVAVQKPSEGIIAL